MARKSRRWRILSKLICKIIVINGGFYLAHPLLITGWSTVRQSVLVSPFRQRSCCFAGLGARFGAGARFNGEAGLFSEFVLGPMQIQRQHSRVAVYECALLRQRALSSSRRSLTAAPGIFPAFLPAFQECTFSCLRAEIARLLFRILSASSLW